MKQAFVVVGPESSGNKLMGALLVRAGCVGDITDEGRGNLWSVVEPATEERVVMVYSYPSGYEWPDLRNVYWRLQNKGYLTWVLVMARDHYCTVRSQQERRLKPAPIAEANYQRAYREIFTQIHAADIPFLVVPYESLVLEPVHAMHRLLETIGLPTDNLGGSFVINGREYTEIRNENDKHYQSG